MDPPRLITFECPIPSCVLLFGFVNDDWDIKGFNIRPQFFTATATSCELRIRETAGPGAWSAWELEHGGFVLFHAALSHLIQGSAFSTQYDIQIRLTDASGHVEIVPDCGSSVFRVTSGSGAGVDGSFEGEFPESP